MVQAARVWVLAHNLGGVTPALIRHMRAKCAPEIDKEERQKEKAAAASEKSKNSLRMKIALADPDPLPQPEQQEQQQEEEEEEDDGDESTSFVAQQAIEGRPPKRKLEQIARARKKVRVLREELDKRDEYDRLRDAAEPPLEVRVADPAEWLGVLADMLTWEGKFVETDYDKIRNNKAERERRFGPRALAPAWPPQYAYLQRPYGHGRRFYHNIVLPTLGDRDVPGVPARQDAAHMSDEVLAGVARDCWTFHNAMQTARLHNLSAAFGDPQTYFAGRDVPPGLDRPGAPAPTSFPWGGRMAVRVPTAYLYPEFLVQMPLPFQARFYRYSINR